RTENPTPAAMSVMKLARNSRRWPAVIELAGAVIGGGSSWRWLSSGLGRLRAGQVHGFISANRLEVEQEQEVDRRHRRGDERVGAQRAACAQDVGLDRRGL